MGTAQLGPEQQGSPAGTWKRRCYLLARTLAGGLARARSTGDEPAGHVVDRPSIGGYCVRQTEQSYL